MSLALLSSLSVGEGEYAKTIGKQAGDLVRVQLHERFC